MLIVIEGIDGAGTTTQLKRVIDYLKRKGVKVKSKKYPDKNNEIGKMIYQMLKEGFKCNLETKFLLYAIDMVKDIKFLSDKSSVIVLDRYFTSTIVYQTVEGFPLKDALEFARTFKLPVPDLVIYIDIPVEVGVERMKKAGKKLDVHERNIEFMKKVRNKYLEIARKNIFGKWITINGSKSINDVSQDIIDALGEFLDIS